MKRKVTSILALCLLLISFLCMRYNASVVKALDGLDISKVYGVQILWNSSMYINDVAVSKDGNYMVAVNNSGLYYFAVDSSVPTWWYLANGKTGYLYSVVISADGEYVAAGDSNGFVYYFNNSRAETGERTQTTWTSVDLGGPVSRGSTDMSDDGEYIIVGGTGISLFYFGGCRGRFGLTEDPTWFSIFGVDDFLTVQMSSDGKYVAAGGRNFTQNGFVMFYSDADIIQGQNPPPNWSAWSSTYSTICDLEVSDDGYAVAAVSETVIDTLYYWANATTLSGDPEPTWVNDGSFGCVDMSADGDEVIAGTMPASPCGLHYWTGARDFIGPVQVENWTRIEGQIVLDAAMSDDGGMIAATTQIGLASDYKAYFFKSDGNMIAEFELPLYSPVLSMSGDGRIVAVGDFGPLTLHVFEVLEDLTPPLIEDVYQQPDPSSVYPDDEVMVFANVSDEESGVRSVFLNYTNGNGTWIAVNMTGFEENIWNATVNAFEYCTWVNYTIVAEDNVGNVGISEEQYQYHVIPEFSLLIVMPLLMTAMLLVAVYRRKATIQL